MTIIDRLLGRKEREDLETENKKLKNKKPKKKDPKGEAASPSPPYTGTEIGFTATQDKGGPKHA